MFWRSVAHAALLAPIVGLAAAGLVVSPSTVVVLLLVLPMTAGVLGFTLAVSLTQSSAQSPADGDPLRAGRRPWTGRLWNTSGVGSLRGGGAWRPPGPDASPVAIRRHGLRVGAAAAAAIVVVVPVMAGLVAVAGAATGALLLVGAMIAAGALWVRHRGRLDDEIGSPSYLAPPPACVVEPVLSDGPRPLVRVLSSLSTPALCAEWQRSLWALTASTDPAVRNNIAELRRRYLDELERRDPEALVRWLALDPRPAGSNPRRHLTRPHDREGDATSTDTWSRGTAGRAGPDDRGDHSGADRAA